MVSQLIYFKEFCAKHSQLKSPKIITAFRYQIKLISNLPYNEMLSDNAAKGVMGRREVIACPLTVMNSFTVTILWRCKLI